MMKNIARGRPLSHARSLVHIKPCPHSIDELTDSELFQDGERNPDGPRVLVFRMPVLNLWGRP